MNVPVTRILGNSADLEPWNIPSIHKAFVDKPRELSLGEHSVVEVQPAILPYIGFPYAQSLNNPVELFISVMVFSCSQCMCDTFNTINNGAGKVVCGINPEKKRSLISRAEQNTFLPPKRLNLAQFIFRYYKYL